MFKLTTTALLGLASAAEWDYKQNGADWKDTCATGKRQSPINLLRSWETTVEKQGWSRVYQDEIKNKEFKWDDHTSKMEFDPNAKPN